MLEISNCCHYFLSNLVGLLQFYTFLIFEVAKGEWDFQISDLVKNPEGTDI